MPKKTKKKTTKKKTMSYTGLNKALVKKSKRMGRKAKPSKYNEM